MEKYLLESHINFSIEFKELSEILKKKSLGRNKAKGCSSAALIFNEQTQYKNAHEPIIKVEKYYTFFI